MFDQYSDRARRIIFIARLKAGQDGAPRIEESHLIASLIIEDQGGNFAKPLTGIPISGSHVTTAASVTSQVGKPFFVSATAQRLLALLEEQSSHLQPIPAAADLPLSAGAERILESAVQLKQRFQHKEVRPLHVLAAALAQNSSTKELFREAGVTEDKVLEAVQLDAA